MKQNSTLYDVIGDIHGHADTLRALLTKLGYIERESVYRHPEREVIFVGDFVDRGPKIRETLQIVRAMVDSGSALAVLGNHEFNAIRYHTLGPTGKPLRTHNEQKTKQHRATLDQLANPHHEEWAAWLAWLKTLPLFLDAGGLRVVHAAWCDACIGVIGNRRFGDAKFLIASSQPETAEFQAVSTLLTGPELALPGGSTYLDKDGHRRTAIRARWFGHRPEGRLPTYRSLVFPPSDDLPELQVAAKVLASLPHYDESEAPVIFGHYWMPPTAPRCVALNAACVDYSVASKQGGLLAAYRWNGETVLSDANFVIEPRA